MILAALAAIVLPAAILALAAWVRRPFGIVNDPGRAEAEAAVRAALAAMDERPPAIDGVDRLAA
jgi:hypothetical protein